MKKTALIIPFILVLLFPIYVSAQGILEKDIIETKGKKLEITFIAHASLMLDYGGMTIHVDPCAMFNDYKNMPEADIILITHEHFDHLDKKVIDKLKKENTEIIINEAGFKQLGEGLVMKNGDKKNISGIGIEAVPAYNIVHMRSENTPYHPKGSGNGYILTLGDKRLYIAGDTENTPEMKALKDIDIAFLPMNLPYTMTPDMAADAAKAFRPDILYPYHYGQTDTSGLVDLLKDEKDIEVRIRKM